MADKQHPPVLERLAVLEEHDQAKREDIAVLKSEVSELRQELAELIEVLQQHINKL